ncbi:acyl-CoA dehydrogenase family protein [Nocardia sp. CY41]|uniref:acyl-CoA dehydrogenase family protein n=1 Tax=Nocardia sp. CY41 TaxID=2608686 RepID=UPI0013589BEC|nr:acyl-CoA dehydrogenase family protein [Nocardia sp. CY41]
MSFTGVDSEDAVAEAVVSVLERENARDFTLWPKLAESGLLSVALPKRCGEDTGLLEVSAMLTELAADAVQVPALTTFGFGVLPLVEAAPKSLTQRIFHAVAQGAILTAALNEPDAPFVATPRTVAVIEGGSVRITGHKVRVPYAGSARWILVPTDCGVAVVDSCAAGVKCVRSPGVSSAPEYSVYFEQAEIPAEQLLIDGGATLQRLAVATIGSVADGLLKGLLRVLTEHIRIHRRFGLAPAEVRAARREFEEVHDVSRLLQTASRSANQLLSHRDDHPGYDERVRDELGTLAHWITAQLPAAMSKCHRLHGGPITAEPFRRYYAQVEDLVRWLGDDSFPMFSALRKAESSRA